MRYYRIRLGDDFNPYGFAQKCYDEKFVGVYYFIEKDFTCYNDIEFENEFLKECDKNLPIDPKKDRNQQLKSRLRLFRMFCREIEVGDILLCPKNNTYSSFLVGKITSDCYFQQGKVMPHRRNVVWLPETISLNDNSSIKHRTTIVKIKDVQNNIFHNNQEEKIKNYFNINLPKLTSGIKHETLNKAFCFMQSVLPSFIGKTLQDKDEKRWWQNLVLKKLHINSIRDLPENGNYDEYIDNLDIPLCLKIIIENWHDIFKKIIKNIKFSWVHELLETRNDISHWTNEKAKKYSFDFIRHTLNAMRLFMQSIDLNTSVQISELIREFEDKYEDKKISSQNP